MARGRPAGRRLGAIPLRIAWDWGLGLSGVRRLVDEFEISSEPGKGAQGRY